MNAWSGPATRAAVDRLAAGRPIDPSFVGQLEVDAVTTVRQGGGSDAAVREALEGVHDGLYVAVTQRPTGNRPSDVTSAILPASNPLGRLPWSQPVSRQPQESVMTDPYYDAHGVTLHHGDCRDALRALPDASVDAVVTDPPYELGFMGKGWDATGIAYDVDLWRECLRVLRPGGHLLAFGGTRTYHRLACAVEDAGFEIRDSIASGSAMLVWCYGSGFPKSRNVSADPLACQCVPDMRDDAVNTAAESAAQVLLSDLRGRSEAAGADIADLHGLPADLRAENALPGDTEQDLLAGMRARTAVADHDGQALASVPTDGRDHLCSLREGVPAEAVPTQGRAGVLLPVVPREGIRVGVDRAQVRCHGNDSCASLRSGEPCLEGWGDVQAAEGQLHRSEVRSVPPRSAGDGAVGRVRDGAPSGDGPLGRSPAAAVRGGQPHQPRPEGQPQGEPGVVPVERGPQAWRGWPLCGRCGKPALPPGLGTALKPAFEPIVVARKPLAGTVAATVLAYGTGALNIDACRVTAGQDCRDKCASVVGLGSNRNGDAYGAWVGVREDSASSLGRWPSNVVLAHSPDCGNDCAPGCPVAELDAQSGPLHTQNPETRKSHSKVTGTTTFGTGASVEYADQKGSAASRFFPTFRYQAKADTAQRPRAGMVTHPTVKPLDLMRWLVRLITPPGGVVLDPFAGSGTTAEACLIEGFRCLTVEREADYLPLILDRITKRADPVANLTAKADRGEDVDLGLFGLLGEAS